MIGEIADPNLWSYAMSAERIVNMTCNDSGDVVNSTSLLASDHVTWFNETYPCLGKALYTWQNKSLTHDRITQ